LEGGLGVREHGPICRPSVANADIMEHSDGKSTGREAEEATRCPRSCSSRADPGYRSFASRLLPSSRSGATHASSLGCAKRAR
jgi:hypothetical protein